MSSSFAMDPNAAWDPVEAKQLESSIDEQLIRVDTKKYTYCQYVNHIRENGSKLRSDFEQPDISEKPSWFDEALFQHAASVYERHFMGINFAHLSGLLLLVRVESIYETLSSTSKSDSVAKLFRRYYHTVRHVKYWYEGDIFDEGSQAHRSLLIVRGMHNKVSSKFNNNQNDKKSGLPQLGDCKSDTIHISKYDIMITQFAFIGFILTRPKRMGLLDDFCHKDVASLVHFWRVIGHCLGAGLEFNLCSYEINDIVGLCEAIVDLEYKSSIMRNPLNSKPGIMSLNIIRSVKFIPMLTIYGMLRYLYDVLELDRSELDSKKNWYSNLSHTLIDLVMTRLLAYKAFRSFNNGLTRLSVFLVGKVENWFTNRLEKSYGSELKAF